VLQSPTPEEKQQVLRLVVDHILVGKGQLTIKHIIPLIGDSRLCTQRYSLTHPLPQIPPTLPKIRHIIALRHPQPPRSPRPFQQIGRRPLPFLIVVRRHQQPLDGQEMKNTDHQDGRIINPLIRAIRCSPP